MKITQAIINQIETRIIRKSAICSGTISMNAILVKTRIELEITTAKKMTNRR